MQDYIIVSATDFTNVSTKVAHYLQLGYRLHGELIVKKHAPGINGTIFRYTQAVVKDDKE